MMRTISTIEVALLARELGALEGFRLEQFYQSGRGTFRFKFASRERTSNLLCILPLTMHETTYLVKQEKASNFAMAVRNRIAGMQVTKVSQYNDDRIIMFKLEGKGKETNLIIELFGKGNMVLTESDMTIDLAYVERDFRTRRIRKGEAYIPPENPGIGISNISSARTALGAGLKEAGPKQNIAAFVSRSANIGTLYVEDAIIKAGVDPRSPAALVEPNALGEICRNMELAVAAIDGPKVRAYMDGDVPVDYAIIDIAKYSAMETRKFGSMQEALDALYHHMLEREDREGSERVRELESSLEKQRRLMKEDEEAKEREREIGRKIYENMDVINSISMALQQNRRMTLKELEDIFPEAKVTSLDLKEKSFTIEV